DVRWRIHAPPLSARSMGVLHRPARPADTAAMAKRPPPEKRVAQPKEAARTRHGGGVWVGGGSEPPGGGMWVAGLGRHGRPTGNCEKYSDYRRAPVAEPEMRRRNPKKMWPGRP